MSDGASTRTSPLLKVGWRVVRVGLGNDQRPSYLRRRVEVRTRCYSGSRDKCVYPVVLCQEISPLPSWVDQTQCVGSRQYVLSPNKGYVSNYSCRNRNVESPHPDTGNWSLYEGCVVEFKWDVFHTTSRQTKILPAKQFTEKEKEVGGVTSLLRLSLYV